MNKVKEMQKQKIIEISECKFFLSLRAFKRV